MPIYPHSELPPNKRKQPLFFLIDLSWTMRGAKIAAVNNAMHIILDALREKEEELKRIIFTIRVIIFSGEASFFVGSAAAGVELAGFAWNDIPPAAISGGAATANAIDLLTSCMCGKCLGRNIAIPCVVLISDGACNNKGMSFRKAVDAMKQNAYARVSVRSAIGIACGAAAKDELLYFVSSPENYVDSDLNPESIVNSIVDAAMNTVMQGTGAERS